jgi:hypothetical protein
LPHKKQHIEKTNFVVIYGSDGKKIRRKKKDEKNAFNFYVDDDFNVYFCNTS